MSAEEKAAKTLLSRINQRNITNDERRDTITAALLEAEARGRAEERERCAKLCDEEEKSETAWMFKYQASGDDNLMTNCQGGATAARVLAAEIRALPAPTEGEGER